MAIVIEHKPRRIDAYRYSWETWCDDGETIVVGLLDHTGEDNRPMMVVQSTRDADILLAVLRALDVKTPGGLPFDPSLDEIVARDD